MTNLTTGISRKHLCHASDDALVCGCLPNRLHDETGRILSIPCLAGKLSQGAGVFA